MARLIKFPLHHVIGGQTLCWCGIAHTNNDLILGYVCQHLANGKYCENEVRASDIFCDKHKNRFAAMWRIN